MSRAPRLGRVAGIDVGAHSSVAVILAITTWIGAQVICRSRDLLCRHVPG